MRWTTVAGSSAADVPAATPDRDGARTPLATLPWLGAAAALAVAVFLVVHRSLIDDAYITMDYARTLGEHFRWGLTPFHTANSATSPLNVLLLGAVTAVVRRPVLALGIVFTALNVLQMWGFLRLARAVGLSKVFAGLGFAVILLSPLMLSIVGMEMTLAITLIVLLADASARGSAKTFGLLSGLLLLTRVDLLVFAVVLLLASRTLRRKVLWAVGCAVAITLPWYVFSWFALGALVPDTLVIKTVAGGGWGSWHFGNGPLLYLQTYFTATALTLIPALLGLLALAGWFLARAWRFATFRGLGVIAAVGVAGLAHYLAYTLLAPPPFHWYFAPSAGALAIVACAGVASVGRNAARGSGPTRAWDADRLAALALPALLLLADVGFAGTRDLPWTQSVIHTNWAEARQYAAIGRALQGEQGLVVSSPGEIGTLAYFCECDIVDMFSDRGAVLPLISQREAEAGPVMQQLLRLNFVNLDRDVAATQPNAALSWRPGPASGPDSWPATSQWRGDGSFVLVRNP